MGFGSYDESEQEKTDVGGGDSIDTTENVREEKADADGEMEFEMGETNEMLSRLKDMQDDDE